MSSVFVMSYGLYLFSDFPAGTAEDAPYIHLRKPCFPADFSEGASFHVAHQHDSALRTGQRDDQLPDQVAFVSVFHLPADVLCGHHLEMSHVFVHLREAGGPQPVIEQPAQYAHAVSLGTVGSPYPVTLCPEPQEGLLYQILCTLHIACEPVCHGKEFTVAGKEETFEFGCLHDRRR